MEVGDLSDLELLRHWKQKALVCVCRDHVAISGRPGTRGGSPYLCGGTTGDWCGPQRKAMKAMREINRRAIPLPRGLYIGVAEDNSCGRRKLSPGVCEFDEIMDAYVAGMEAALGPRH